MFNTANGAAAVVAVGRRRQVHRRHTPAPSSFAHRDPIAIRVLIALNAAAWSWKDTGSPAELRLSSRSRKKRVVACGDEAGAQG